MILKDSARPLSLKRLISLQIEEAGATARTLRLSRTLSSHIP